MGDLFAAGVDIGGTHVSVGIVNQKGVLLKKESRNVTAVQPFEIVVMEIARSVLLLAEQMGFQIGEIAGTGFGVPSTIDPRSKKLIFANNLYWLNRDLRGEYSGYIPGPVYIENDADCAAFGEAMTDPDARKNMLMITFGTGFGGGLIIDGKIFRGFDGFGMEPGHTVLVYGGRECNCGNSGCVEAYVSVAALARLCREKMDAFPDSLMWEDCMDSSGRRDSNLAGGRTAFIAARKGDRAALEVLEEFTAVSGQAIANLITLFRPEKVIIGGGLSNEGDFFINPLYDAAKKRIFGSGIMPMPPFGRARLGNDAGMIGAALLAISPLLPADRQ